MVNQTLKLSQSTSLIIDGEVLKVPNKSHGSRHQPSCCGLRRTSESTAGDSIPLYNVLDAQIEWAAATLTITYVETANLSNISVNALQYPIILDEKLAVESWISNLLDRAYGDAQRYKRLKVLVNPFPRRGAAMEIFKKLAEPIFASAHCHIDLEATKYRGHASDIAEKIVVDSYDAIVCCSGDGLPHEVFNGLARKSNAGEALRSLAVAMIPCGSGNAMAWNLYGTDNAALSALAIVKGHRMSLDLASITQGENRILSFLSQSFGLIAHSDLGTENLRWMGDSRFFLGVLDCLVNSRVNFPCDLAMKVVTDDKDKISREYHSYLRERQHSGCLLDGESVGLPELTYGTVLDDLANDWEVIPAETLGTFFAGNMAIVSKDANFFPAALPNDGLLDIITVDGAIGFIPSLKVSLSVSEDNAFFHHANVVVRKVAAYRLVPRGRESYISVDGERLPFKPFQVEVHAGLGTVIAKSGYCYQATGPKPPPGAVSS